MNQQPLSLRVIQLFGLGLIVVSVVVTLITGKPTFDFLGAAVTLVTVGSVWGQQVRRFEEQYEVPPERPSPTPALPDEPASASDILASEEPI